MGTTEVSTVQYSSSTNVLEKQAMRSSIGAEWKLNVEGTAKKVASKGLAGGNQKESIDENTDVWNEKNPADLNGGAAMEIRFGFHFGHSRESSNGRKEAKYGFSYSFESRSESTFYGAAVDWNGYHGDFKWKSPLLQDVES